MARNPVFAATNLSALNARNGQEVWHSSPEPGMILVRPLYVADGVVYVDEDGLQRVKPALLAVTLTTGKKLWIQPIEVFLGAIQNGIMYIGLAPTQLATVGTTDGTWHWH